MCRRLLATALLLLATSIARGEEKVTYQDHVRPIFVASCLGCHNPDKKKAGLDLSTYAGAMAGSSGGKVIEPGDPDMSMLYLAVTHQQEPFMPKDAAKLPDKQIEVIKKWLAGGALDTGASVAATSSKPKVTMMVTTAPTTAPAGPGPMPPEISLEPVVRSERPGAPLALAVSSRSPLVAIGSQRQVLLYHASTYELLGIVPFRDGLPKVLAFSRSGELLLAAGGEAASAGKVVLFDVRTANRIAEIGQESDEVLAADISRDQTMVALGGPAKIVKTFSTANGQPIHKLTKHTDWITALAYSPDGVLLASGDRAGNLRVWEAVSGNEFYTLAGHKAAVTDVCFRADSNVLLSSSEDGTAKLWDMSSGKEIKNIAAHPGGVLSADFAADGRFVTSGRDRVVRVWKPDGAKLKDLPAMNEIALHAVFSSDGTKIICDDWSGQVRVTDITSAKPVAKLDCNPPMIAERIAAARAAVSQAQPTTAPTTAPAAITALATLRKWQRAKVFAELCAVKQEFDRLADQQERLSQALKQLEQAELALREGPKRVADLTQRVELARKQAPATTQKAQSAKSAVSDHEPVMTHAAEALKQIEALRAKNPQSKAVTEAAQKAKESVDLLVVEVNALRASAATAEDAAKRAAAEQQAAEAALAAAQAEVAAAPARAEEARKLIANSLTGDLRELKARLDRLTAEHEQLADQRR